MKKMIKVLRAGLSLISLNVSAITVDGTLIVGGAYEATGGVNLADATSFSLGSVYANGATGDVVGSVNIFTPVGTGGGLSLVSFVPVTNFFTVGGWQLDATSLIIEDQEAGLLTLIGKGVFSGNGFEATDAFWSFSSSSTTSYSMTVTAGDGTGTVSPVPVPIAIWLFGSGLLALVGVARRKI